MIALTSFHGMAGESSIAEAFNTSADPMNVQVGQTFTVTYTIVNPQQKADYRRPEFKNFKVVTGESTSREMSIVNNVQSQKLKYSYVLQAVTEGSMTSSKATVIVGKAQATDKGGKKHFFQCELSKTEVYVGEPLIATFRVYSTTQLRADQDVFETPSFDGFWVKEIEDVKDPNGQVVVKGTNYGTLKVKEYLLIPQSTGKQKIKPADLRVSIPERVQVRTFFGPRTSTEWKRNVLTAPKRTITVKPLPKDQQPASFNGAVGQYKLISKVNKKAVKANESVNYTIGFSGSGNVELLNALKPNLPPDLETYDPQIKGKVNVTSYGMSGAKSFEYLLIPRFGGEFEIPALEFSYFDPNKEQYVVLTEPAILLNVEGETGASMESSGSSIVNSRVQRVESLADDIRFLQTGSTVLRSQKDRFFHTGLYYLLLCLPLAFGAGYGIWKSMAGKFGPDQKTKRRKLAGKWAQEHLKSAKTVMNSESKVFYEEIFKALNGYLSDKLDIPLAKMNRSVIVEDLTKRGVDGATIDELTAVLDMCEMARFAPVTGQSQEEMYDKATAILLTLNKDIS